MSEAALATPQDLFNLFESEKFKKKLLATLPAAITPDKMIQLALTMIRSSPSLMRCTPLSLYASIVECAQMGLEPDKLFGHAYLVPFRRGDVHEAQLIVGYRGFCHLMYRSGSIISVSAEIVRPGDKFKRILGTNRALLHEPSAFPKNDDPEKWIGAYAVARFLHGETDFEFMDREQIVANRNRSQSWRAFKNDGKSTPWVTDAEEMFRKTAIRKLSKRMPQSKNDERATLLRAVMLDEYGSRGLLRPTLEGWEVTPEAVAEPIAPTLEKDLEESIRIVEEKKTKSAPQAGAPKPAVPPKATIPPAPQTGAPKKERGAAAAQAAAANAAAPNDPVLDSKQQTALWDAALSMGWVIPEHVMEFLEENYKLTSVKQVRASQLAGILQKIRSSK